MDVNSLEIYIPVEAEVKSIPLCSLPDSVLRRMGISLSDPEGSRKLADSPEGTWICPAIIRRKGQKPASHTGNGVVENVSSLLGRQVRGAQGPFRMSFVSSNRTAYRVLKDTISEQMVSHASDSTPLPPGSAPQTYKDAVVIYLGRIYLSIRKPGRRQSQQSAREPPSQSSTSDLLSKNNRKRQNPQASVEHADKEPQGKRSHVTVPQISPKQTKDLLSKTSNRSTAVPQKAMNNNCPTIRDVTFKVTPSKKWKDVTPKGRDGSSSKTSASVPQCSDSVRKVDSKRHKDAAEEAAALQPSWFQPQGGKQQQQQEEVAANNMMLDLGGDEVQSTNQNNDMDCNIHTDGGEPDNMVGQSSNQSWTKRESQGAACASTSLQVDFKELAQEETIALMKAKLRESEAALKNLPI